MSKKIFSKKKKIYFLNIFEKMILNTFLWSKCDFLWSDRRVDAFEKQNQNYYKCKNNVYKKFVLLETITKLNSYEKTYFIFGNTSIC